MDRLGSPVNPGDRLDHYRIESVVARGSLATVFHATDLRTNREVAIKVPLPEMQGDPTFADWFRREQEAGESLDHPGIVKVISDPDRTEPYIVMEWFGGQSLRQVLQEHARLAPERAVRIAVSICHALEYLHGRGIVHRDLSPENVMVDAEDRIKLVDFGGTAKATARRLTFTKIAQVAGASDYVSPEELKGKRVDARSDIYSLGVLLYQMLTGKTPFPGSGPLERLRQHPVPPREVDPSISPQLQEVIYRALEREPQNRYTTAREFAHDLEHLDQVGVAERPEVRDWKKARGSQRKRLFLYGAMVLIPLALFGLLFYFARH